MSRATLHTLLVMTLITMAGALPGCACRPGFVGPYGGVHPGGCWVG